MTRLDWFHSGLSDVLTMTLRRAEGLDELRERAYADFAELVRRDLIAPGAFNGASSASASAEQPRRVRRGLRC